jgi:hypothetical protein
VANLFGSGGGVSIGDGEIAEVAADVKAGGPHGFKVAAK